MTSTFRTAGAWGAGVGRPLTWVEQDNNTYDKEVRLANLESPTAGGGAVGIDYIEVIGDQMIIHMTDSSIQGPFTLSSSAPWSPQGYWQPTHVYQALDTVQYAGALYLVLADHSSDTTFDPNAIEDTHSLYQLIANFAPAQGFSVSTATFEPDLSYANSYVRLTNATGCAVTIDTGVLFADWTEIHFRDCSTSNGVSFDINGSGQLNPPDGYNLLTAGPGATVGMKKVADTDEWDVWGLLQATTA